jgi:hypothetical protein
MILKSKANSDSDKEIIAHIDNILNPAVDKILS